jgi:hypothetical protein
MKRIYIAGKIGGLSEAEYTANFNNAKIEVKAMGHDPVSPTDLPHEHERTWLAYMREDLKALLECDGVYALSNWEDSPGAKVEIGLAQSLGLEVVYQSAYHEICTTFTN